MLSIKRFFLYKVMTNVFSLFLNVSYLCISAAKAMKDRTHTKSMLLLFQVDSYCLFYPRSN